MHKLLGALVALVAGLALVAGPASAQTTTGTVTVLHGIPDVPVDVYVNGELTLPDFQPETVTDPLELPAGNYSIEIRPAGDEAADPILEGSTDLPGGANASIVAHLTADGEPELTVYVNDIAPTAAGQGRLVIRHDAAAPAVDVLVDGQPVDGFTGLTNPNEAQADLPAGTLNAAVAATGTTDPVIGPTDVPVVEGQATIVYAVGSLEDGTLTALVQTISGLHTPPGEVATGNSGLAADESSSNANGLWVAAGAIAVLGLGTGTALVRVRRARV
jgi:hypothetical protein